MKEQSDYKESYPLSPSPFHPRKGRNWQLRSRQPALIDFLLSSYHSLKQSAHLTTPHHCACQVSLQNDQMQRIWYDKFDHKTSALRTVDWGRWRLYTKCRNDMLILSKWILNFSVCIVMFSSFKPTYSKVCNVLQKTKLLDSNHHIENVLAKFKFFVIFLPFVWSCYSEF